MERPRLKPEQGSKPALRREFVLQHGWGFDARIWQPWLGRLQAITATDVNRPNVTGGCIVQTTDRGYFREPVHRDSVERGAAKILVVHSFGLHTLLPEALSSYDALVLISSFNRFIADSETLLRRTHRQMQSKFRSAPADVLNDFYSNCFNGSSDLPPITQLYLRAVQDKVANLPLLEDDLDRLGKSNLFKNVTTTAMPGPILILHGGRDTIVSLAKAQELHECLPRSVLKVHDTANHALPFLEPAWCMEQISEHLTNLTDRRLLEANHDGGSQNRAD